MSESKIGPTDGAFDDWLTYKDTERVLAKLSSVVSKLVLVGGQAVNFWSETYRQQHAGLLEGPYASKDIDFWGPGVIAREAARLLQGRALYPSVSDHAPVQTAKVVFSLEDKEREIDFLATVHGVTDPGKVALEVAIIGPDDLATGQLFLAMHPVDCVFSRVTNVATLPQYQTPHGLQQLRASLICASEYIKGLAAGGQVRSALALSEDLCTYAMHRNAVEVYRKYGIEVFDAVYPHPGMPDLFASKRYPQMVQQIERKRRKLVRG